MALKNLGAIEANTHDRARMYSPSHQYCASLASEKPLMENGKWKMQNYDVQRQNEQNVNNDSGGSQCCWLRDNVFATRSPMVLSYSIT